MQTNKQENSLWKRLPGILTTPVSVLLGSNKTSAKKTHEVPRGAPRTLVLEGMLIHGSETNFAVDSVDFAIKEETWVFGELEYGAQAKVFYSIISGGKVANKIVITAPPAR